jgi:hypothetical protein
MGKCKFNKEWLSSHPWLEEDKNDECKAKCKLCNKDFSVSNKGYHAVKLHMETSAHQTKQNAAASTVAIDSVFQSNITCLLLFFFSLKYKSNIFCLNYREQ